MYLEKKVMVVCLLVTGSNLVLLIRENKRVEDFIYRY